MNDEIAQQYGYEDMVQMILHHSDSPSILEMLREYMLKDKSGSVEEMAETILSDNYSYHDAYYAQSVREDLLCQTHKDGGSDD